MTRPHYQLTRLSELCRPSHRQHSRNISLTADSRFLATDNFLATDGLVRKILQDVSQFDTATFQHYSSSIEIPGVVVVAAGVVVVAAGVVVVAAGVVVVAAGVVDVAAGVVVVAAGVVVVAAVREQ